jgi:hypothetical protein
VGGYVLTSSVTTEPLGLAADLLHALGWSLWTGVVVVVFAQIVPEANGVRSSRGLKKHRPPPARASGPHAQQVMYVRYLT